MEILWLNSKINLVPRHTKERVNENSLIFVIPQWLPSRVLDNDSLIMNLISQYYAKFLTNRTL